MTKTYAITNVEMADILDLLIGHKDFKKIATMLAALPLLTNPTQRFFMVKVTDAMVDAHIAFTAKISYLSHPDVPYLGTVNGDSPEEWARRVTKAGLFTALNIGLVK